MAKNHSKIKFILIIGLTLRILLVLISNWHPDLPNHIDWGNRFLSYGSHQFYEKFNLGEFLGPINRLVVFFLFAFMALIKNWLFGFIMFLNNNIPVFPSFIIPILELKLHAWLVKLPLY